MSHLTLLIPFALPPVDMGPDLLRSMQTPSLAMLLGRSQLNQTKHTDAFARALPHEYWLADAAGLVDTHRDNSPAVATQSLARFDVAISEGSWFVVNPVHLHIARDHLVLTDQRRLAMDDDESRQLFAIAQPVFDEYGHTVLYGDATTWFLRADTWHNLRTATPDAACGHNIDIWMPTGAAERDWRKLQNDLQMHWHDAPVNLHRQATGKNPVNSLWLWGGEQIGGMASSPRYENVFLQLGSMQYFGGVAQDMRVGCDVATVIGSKSTANLLVLDSLIAPALGDDLGEWLIQINALEADWFAPILQAIKSGAIDGCHFILTNATSLQERSISGNGLRKFWRAPSLSTLLP
jgi:hypothetical protein